MDHNELSFDVFRVEGVDVYGSFLIGISLKNEAGKNLLQLNGNDLAQLSPQTISNYYVAKIKPGKHSLVIPLGSKATIRIPIDNKWNFQKSAYTLTLTDISGATWVSNL